MKNVFILLGLGFFLLFTPSLTHAVQVSNPNFDSTFINSSKQGNNSDFPKNFTWSEESWGYGITTDTNGYIYTVGWLAGVRDLLLVKWDTLGNPVWNCTWGGKYSIVDTVEGYDVTVDDNGSIYTVGEYEEYSLLVKWDKNGRQIFDRTWEWGAYRVTTDKTGNIYTLEESLRLVKWDSEGNQVWSRIIEDAIGHDLTTDANGHIYITAETHPFGTPSRSDFHLIKWDNTGNQLWIQNYDAYTDSPSIVTDPNGSIYVLAYPSLLKYDSNGDVIWNQTIFFWGGDITLAQDGSIYILTHEYPDYPNFVDTNTKRTPPSDFLLAKHNCTGHLIGIKVWNDGFVDYASEVIVGNDGNIYCVGSTGRGLNFRLVVVVFSPMDFSPFTFSTYSVDIPGLEFPIIILTVCLIIYLSKKRKSFFSS